MRFVHERDRHGRPQGVPEAYVRSKDHGSDIDAVGSNDAEGNAGVPNTQRVKVETLLGKVLAQPLPNDSAVVETVGLSELDERFQAGRVERHARPIQKNIRNVLGRKAKGHVGPDDGADRDAVDAARKELPQLGLADLGRQFREGPRLQGSPHSSAVESENH